MKRSIVIGIIAACLVSVFVFSFGTTQVSELAGLAVAQGSKWIGVRDAAVGDGIGSGVLASSLMMYDSANGVFNRLRGSTAFGIQVDVTRIAGGTLTVVGNKTPSDTFANPTDAIASFSLLGYWDGTQWVRWRAFQNIDAIGVTNSPHTQALNYGFNGSTWDRLRATGDNVANTTIGKLHVLPCKASDPPTIQSWTIGNTVPLNCNIAGSLFVQQRGIMASTQGASAVYSVQGLNLFNSETTGAANTAVTVTIPADAGAVQRVYLYSIEAQCSSTGTATITVQDGATTIWTTKGANVPSAPSVFVRTWPVPLTGSTGAAMTITLSACGVGSAGTLTVQASRV